VYWEVLEPWVRGVRQEMVCRLGGLADRWVEMASAQVGDERVWRGSRCVP
jgi:hypothetical protein